MYAKGMASGYVETYIQGSSGICASSSTVNCITDKTYPSPRNSKSVFPIDDSQLRVLYLLYYDGHYKKRVRWRRD